MTSHFCALCDTELVQNDSSFFMECPTCIKNKEHLTSVIRKEDVYYHGERLLDKYTTPYTDYRTLKE